MIMNMMWWSSMEKPPPVPVEEQNIVLRALCSALAFESQDESKTEEIGVQVHSLAKGRVSPNLGHVDLEETFYDAVEFHDEDLHLAISESRSLVEMIRGGAPPLASVHEQYTPSHMYDAPLPPDQTPLRFIRAGKNDPIVGRQRYQDTLAWRKEMGMNTILKEPHEHFELIKEHYPHYYHFKGKNGMYCYYEKPPKTNLKALKSAGLEINDLLRHYAFVTEFGWQYIDRNDLGRSIYIIDLNGIRFTDFVGECVDFVKKTASFTGQHYPERAGYIYVINVPSWFKVIWSVVKPLVDEDTLKKVFILRGKREIFNALAENIDVCNIPPEYGGTSPPLGQAPEEELLWNLVRHNNALGAGFYCQGIQCRDACPFCTFRYARSY